jgi:hypothetical protein
MIGVRSERSAYAGRGQFVTTSPPDKQQAD